MPEHSVITDPDIHEPKGVASAASGHTYVADGAGSGNWQFPKPNGVDTASANQVYVADGAGGGSFKTPWNNWWWNVDHSATTPTALTSGVKTDLVNDASGVAYLDFQVPSGVSDIWDTTSNEFDWTAGGLSLGDEVFLRIDFEFTASTNNDGFLLEIDLAHGTGGEINLPILETNIDTAGTHQIVAVFRVFMGNTDVLNNPAKLSITADSAGDSYLLNGFYVSAEPTHPRFV